MKNHTQPPVETTVLRPMPASRFSALRARSVLALALGGLALGWNSGCNSGGGTTPGGKAGSTGAGGSVAGTGGATGAGSGGSGQSSAGTAGTTGTGGGSAGTSGLAGGSGGATAGTGGGPGTGGGSGDQGSGGSGGSSSPTDAGAGGNGHSDGSAAGDASARPARVLLYWFSKGGNVDPSVPMQITDYKQKLMGWQYTVDDSQDPSVFTDANLAKYAAVGMINNCYSPFGVTGSQDNKGTAQAQALESFVKQGGGLFGTHCADVTDTGVDPIYNQVLGGKAIQGDYYDGAMMCQRMGTHSTIMALPDMFTYNGNLDHANANSDSTVVVHCKFGGGKNVDTPVSWVRTEGAGRVFFTSFGKFERDLTDATIGPHIYAGLAWVLGRS